MNEILAAAADEVQRHYMARSHVLRTLQKAERNPFAKFYYGRELRSALRGIRAARKALEALGQ